MLLRLMTNESNYELKHWWKFVSQMHIVMLSASSWVIFKLSFLCMVGRCVELWDTETKRRNKRSTKN